VDDDADIREMLALLLELNGYRARGAEDGLAALELIREHGPPAGVLLDLRMPRMSGVEFVRAIQSDPMLAGIPVAVLSGDPHSFSAADVPNAIWLQKPCDSEHLLEVIRRWLPRSPDVNANA
jgi:CheY-like chemotaxis protein